MKKPRKNTRFDKEPNTKCDYCGKGFFRYNAEKRRCKKSFCSSSCMGKWNKENLYSSLNTICEYCKTKFHRSPSRKIPYSVFFCSNSCQGKWKSENECGENGYNWKGGKTAQRKKELQSTGYRTWRAKLLIGVQCILCDCKTNLELHHIESRKDNIDRLKDESNVCPLCSKCHDIFHSNSSKGEELRENLNAILAHGNPQASLSNVVSLVDRKLQRLTGEDTQTNNPDTRIAPERDEIVRAYPKG